MHKATFIRRLDGFRGDARLYRCEGGDLPAYVAVSAVVVPFIDEPETYIFTADEGGQVTDWTELPGSFKGDLDHAEALRLAGYAVTS